MTKISAKFHHDAGHGWLKISVADFVKAKCSEKISVCSYYDKHFVYLEEDCDATRFEEAAKAQGFEVEHEATIYDGDNSPIRRKARYKPCYF